MIAFVLAAFLNAHATRAAAPAPPISIASECPLRITATRVAQGRGFDRDSIYGSFYIIYTTADEYLYIYKLQLRSANNFTDVREAVGSTPIMPHSQGWYQDYIGAELFRPDRYALEQAFFSCVKTTP